MSSYNLSHLADLEHEAIFVIREAGAQFERAAILFSGGKDSLVLVRLAQKAFAPSRAPFPLVHIDTGHNFPETLAFRDDLARRTGLPLIVRQVEDTIRAGRAADETGAHPSRNALQSVTLLDTIAEFKFDACLGGARRDEEKARAKERFFSHRDEFGQWDPKNQRPELWHLFNGRKHPGEHFRVFPLSDWTELDVWHYIQREELAVPSIYFSHQREVVRRGGLLLARSPCLRLAEGESFECQRVRFRTVGDMTCTGGHESTAATVAEVIREIAAARVSERASREDDQRSDTAMEDRKKAGYF
ncbi:MAG TPA: sulfate adenylyltransferase subunit CysD [Opitutaceae bacterium]|nr:sulfate adenylyltransferase subunit CysD [Opitutaceae bacterium]